MGMAVNGFQSVSKKASIMPLEKESSSIAVSNNKNFKSLGDAVNHKALTSFASATVWMMNVGIDPAFAKAAETAAKPSWFHWSVWFFQHFPWLYFSCSPSRMTSKQPRVLGFRQGQPDHYMGRLAGSGVCLYAGDN